MKIIDLLNKIENDEIEDCTIFEVIGDFIYKLIVIKKNLYSINDMTKQLELLDSKHIGIFDDKQYEIVKLSNKVEEKKIPEKLKSLNNVGNVSNLVEFADKQQLNNHLLKNKLNELIDYLKSKGDE